MWSYDQNRDFDNHGYIQEITDANNWKLTPLPHKTSMYMLLYDKTKIHRTLEQNNIISKFHEKRM